MLKGAVLLDRQSPCVGDVVTATPSGLNVPEDRVTYQWYRVKDGVETAVDGATEPSYTATDTDMGCSLVCRLTSTDPIYQGSISSGPADPVRSPEAFAVYSADDGSLCFYKRAAKPSVGDTFEGKKVTAVYTGFETKNYYEYNRVPWNGVARNVKTATVVDEGIQPINTSYWFYDASYMTSCDLAKLDTSKVWDMERMFSDCKSLKSLNGLSNWDTSNVENMEAMF